ncbi:hypothetical protein JOE27_004645 [Pseudomonas sp. M5]|nr:hypothetical protein [Pseudomonas sp. M5]
MCRERAAKRPQDSAAQHKLLGLLRSPFATRGRSYLQQGADGRAEQSQVVMALKALKAAHTPVGAALCREWAAKRPQDSAAQHKLLGLLRSPFATRGRSYLQQGAAGRIEQSQVIMALKALKAAHTPVGAALCREGPQSGPKIQQRNTNCWVCCAALSRHEAAPTCSKVQMAALNKAR